MRGIETRLFAMVQHALDIAVKDLLVRRVGGVVMRGLGCGWVTIGDAHDVKKEGKLGERAQVRIVGQDIAQGSNLRPRTCDVVFNLVLSEGTNDDSASEFEAGGQGGVFGGAAADGDGDDVFLAKSVDGVDAIHPLGLGDFIKAVEEEQQFVVSDPSLGDLAGDLVADIQFFNQPVRKFRLFLGPGGEIENDRRGQGGVGGGAGEQPIGQGKEGGCLAGAGLAKDKELLVHVLEEFDEGFIISNLLVGLTCLLQDEVPGTIINGVGASVETKADQDSVVERAMENTFDPEAADSLTQDSVIALVAPVGGVDAGEMEAAFDVASNVDLGALDGLIRLTEGTIGHRRSLIDLC